jgi:hypothetical protein
VEHWNSSSRQDLFRRGQQNLCLSAASRNSLAYTFRNCNSYGNCDGQRDSNFNSDVYGNCYSHFNFDPDCYSYSDSYRQANTYSPTARNAPVAAESSTAADTLMSSARASRTGFGLASKQSFGTRRNRP